MGKGSLVCETRNRVSEVVAESGHTVKTRLIQRTDLVWSGLVDGAAVVGVV